MAEPYVYICEVDLNQPLKRHDVGLLADYDNNANRFYAKLTRDGAEVDATGYTVLGYFIRPNDETVMIEGEADGNTVYVDLPANCYYYDGAFVLTIKISIENTDFEQAVSIFDGKITQTRTDAVVDNERILPSVQEIAEKMEAVDAATKEAEEIALELRTAADSGEFNGTSVTVQSVSESSTDGGSNVVTFSDGKTLTVKNGTKGKNGNDANVTADNIHKALGYTPLNPGEYAVSVTAYGAAGDGTTDDTAAFQSALSENRKVYVPGGTYKLSGELIIGMNCQLELAQDAFLDFKQTSGNCISMRAGSNIIGNHATINVPYAFTGKAINIYAGIDSGIFGVPPLKTGKWGPMWAAARYITDLHIVKLNYGGIARSVDGTCGGTAVYLRASYQDSMNFLWAVDLNKLRIAGGFTYGIHLDSEINPADPMDGWIHQTKIDGFITGCEVAVYLKDSTLSYISVRITPDWGADNNARYCKHGIVLENSTNVDLSQSRVMDWDTNHTLWTEGGQYQHLALLGNCAGLILSEHYYYDSPNNDIRSLIYTNNPSNLEKLTILQEPFTRWFKPIEGVPYFNNGFVEKKLLLQEEFEECFSLERIPDFENVLPKTIGTDGMPFNNGLGYYPYGKRWVVSSGALADETYYGCTGLIPIKPGDTVYTSQITWKNTDGIEGAVILDANFNRITSCTGSTVANMGYFFGYAKTDEGFALTLNAVPDVANAAYVGITFERTQIGDDPMVSVNTPMSFSQRGFLADSVDVKAENVYGLDNAIDARIATAIGSAIGGSY